MFENCIVVTPPKYVYVSQELLDRCYVDKKKKSLPVTVENVPSTLINEHGLGWYVNNNDGKGFTKCDTPVLTDDMLEYLKTILFRAGYCAQYRAVSFTETDQALLELAINQFKSLRNIVKNHLSIDCEIPSEVST